MSDSSARAHGWHHQDHPVKILLVEDNLADARLTMECLSEGRVTNQVVHVTDGDEALAYLSRQGPHKHADQPHLILLDLNLPKRDGREVLEKLKNDPELKKIPVVILTSSKAEIDIVKSYTLHANCYITKPVALDEFFRVVRSIEDFWFTIVQLPRGE